MRRVRRLCGERGQAMSEYLVVAGIVAAMGLAVAVVLSKAARNTMFGAVHAVRTIAP